MPCPILAAAAVPAAAVVASPRLFRRQFQMPVAAAVLGATVLLASPHRAHATGAQDSLAGPDRTGPPAGDATRQASSDLRPALFSALLSSAIDPDVERLQWVDARDLLGCQPGTRVRVDGQPLVAARYVPDHAFELEWHARACHPFGAGGPVLDGTVRYFVAREDWGFSAKVQVADDARLSDDHGITRLAPGSTSSPIDAAGRAAVRHDTVAIDAAGRPVDRAIAASADRGQALR